jgi:hypothetical protein
MDPDKSDKYNLIQLFNDSNHSTNELLINDQFNVYYAIKNVDDLQFVLRPKIFLNQNVAPYIQSSPLNQQKKYNQFSNSPKINSSSLLPPQALDFKKNNNWNLFKK